MHKIPKIGLAQQILSVSDMGGFLAHNVDPRLNEVGVQVEQLGENSHLGSTSFLHKLDNFLVQFLRGDVLVAIGGSEELEPILEQLDDDLGHCAF